MSSTILRELNREQRANGGRLGQNRIVEFWNGVKMDMTAVARMEATARGGIVEDLTAVKSLIGGLPYRRHCEAMEREHEAYIAAGRRSVCERCGERAVKDMSVKTLGSPRRAHHGDEYSVYRKCENCGHGEL